MKMASVDRRPTFDSVTGTVWRIGEMSGPCFQVLMASLDNIYVFVNFSFTFNVTLFEIVSD